MIFFIPALSDRPSVSKEERQIVSLPSRNGGLGLINPTQLYHHHQDSAYLTGPLANNTIAQVESLGAATAMLAVRKREAQLAVRARARERATAIEIRESAGKPIKALLETASEKKLANLPNPTKTIHLLSHQQSKRSRNANLLYETFLFAVVLFLFFPCIHIRV